MKINTTSITNLTDLFFYTCDFKIMCRLTWLPFGLIMHSFIQEFKIIKFCVLFFMLQFLLKSCKLTGLLLPKFWLKYNTYGVSKRSMRFSTMRTFANYLEISHILYAYLVASILSIEISCDEEWFNHSDCSLKAPKLDGLIVFIKLEAFIFSSLKFIERNTCIMHIVLFTLRLNKMVS